MTSARFCIVVGLVLGTVWAFGGFWRMLLVAVVAAVAFGIGRVLDGRVDIVDWAGRLQGRR
ncbi:DUF2273 domain-containing protein [Zhihengliuella halotolerans]|uniref:Small integral membrane protein DUF2273 n=1 Tax=Zhihengliuella halotolerans TaxID=370736 RepID=A0A4Q8AFZ4_9MICC|nr:DUF2273 domain-containing protein [Zhihengliuella halotolerans]MCO1337819.1 hypothetical protein [Kocuria polaris]RZU63262.1 small integral membrane protein DUF2273 [Zhihengliuella halotolerans]